MYKSTFYSILFMLCLASSNVLSFNQPIKWQSSLKVIEQQQPFKIVGKATLSILFWDLYKSKLSTSSGLYPMQQKNEKLMYEIEYLKAVSTEDLIEYTIEQWKHLQVRPQRYQLFLPKLASIWPDMRVGDSLALVIDQQSSAFYYNDNLVGSIDDPKFGPLFLDIWVSEKSSEPKLRQQLLGNIQDD